MEWFIQYDGSIDWAGIVICGLYIGMISIPVIFMIAVACKDKKDGLY